MKLWYQSLARESDSTNYRPRLRKVIEACVDPGTEVHIQGVTQSAGMGVMYHYLRYRDTKELIDNALRAEQEGYDAFLIGNFSDSGLAEAREMRNIPVLGICETSMHIACMMGASFGLIPVSAKQTKAEFMSITRYIVWMFMVGAAVLGAGVGYGQDPSTGSGQVFPNKPIRIVVGGAGGGGDFVARVIAQGLPASLGQQVIVVNYPSGFIPGETVAKASPDGYTLLSIASNLWLGPLMQKTPYDPVKDFSAVTLAASSPLILVVHPSLPVKSVKEFIALAKARPGELNYATGATGSGGHLSAELFKAMAGVDMVRIPYTSGSARMTALMGGEVQLEFVATGAVAPHIKSGRLRPLAVTGSEPSVLAPGLPTIAASGVPGYESSSTYGIFAPSKTPAILVQRLNQEIVRVLNTADVKDKLFNSGMETVGSTPEKFAATIKSEMARMGKVIKEAGIREP